MFNIQQFFKMMQNPQGVIQNLGIPQEHMQTPQSVAQYLLDNGKVTQEQINQASSMYQQMFGRR